MLDGDNQLDLGADRALRSAPFLAFLLSLRGIGPARAIRIATDGLSIEGVESALRIPSLRDKFAAWQTATMQWQPEWRLIGYFDPEYPPRLRTLLTPPAVLWVWGKLPTQLRGVGVVGTRSPTQSGANCAKSVGSTLDANEHFLVSGLADGVDFLAHESSLAAGIVNVAVLGEGFLALRTENRQALAVKIVLSGGVVLSELPPDAPSTAGSFIERDRIIAGLADVLVVAQCGIPSGTLHTVAVAKQLGLPLMVAKLTGDPRLFRGNLHLSGKLQENLSEGEWAALERLDLLDLGDLEVSEFGTAAEFKELMHP